MNQRFNFRVALGCPWRPLLFCSAVLLSAPVASAAGFLNDTGMTRCVVDGAFTSACTGTGQDAEFGRDVSQPKGMDGHAGFSFQKVCNSGEWAGVGECPSDPALGPGAAEWGCTRDKVTGLIWEVKTTDGGARDQSRLYTQKAHDQPGTALAFVGQVNAAGLCGAQDWRLPTAAELSGLVDFGVAPPGPTLDGDWFPNTPSGFGGYWAADGYAADLAKAWFVDFDTGVAFYTKRQYPRTVRLVRGTAQTAALRPAGDEVRDASTGLIWRRCTEGQSWDGSTCAGAPVGREWGEALALAQAEAARTGVAWRLPNAKELASIVDRGVTRPSINRKAFPNTAKDDWYWSSTAMSGDASYAWLVSFETGFVARLNYPTYVFKVRLVRDAP
jgi:hypothetical protein